MSNTDLFEDQPKSKPNELKTDDILLDNVSNIGLYGLTFKGQNIALNIANQGFKISICNTDRISVDNTVKRGNKELNGNNIGNLIGFKDVKDFVTSIKKPRNIIVIAKDRKDIDGVINELVGLLDSNDLIIDGSNDWYKNSQSRSDELLNKQILYIGMGIIDAEFGTRKGATLMIGGDINGYKRAEPILSKIAVKDDDSNSSVGYIGTGGCSSYVSMVYNGIEYTEMELIAEAYDILKNIIGLSNAEISGVFKEWNKGELSSKLIEITSKIFETKDDRGNNDEYLIDKILDKIEQNNADSWIINDAVTQGIAVPTIYGALNARFISFYKKERIEFESFIKLNKQKPNNNINKKAIIDDIGKALFASKVCLYTQAFNLIQKANVTNKWNINVIDIISILNVGSIIKGPLLDRITKVYKKNPKLKSLLFDIDFVNDIKNSLKSWRKVVILGVNNGISLPSISASLAYFDMYRRSRLPANLTQAQRDFFGAHTYQRIDSNNVDDCKDNLDVFGKFVHSEWNK